MKTIIAAMIIVMAVSEAGLSQNINWRSLREDQQNLVQVSFGYDYGVTTQLSYSRSLVIIKPVLLGFDYSFPMGKDLTDDFKVRLGAQVEIVEAGGFSATLKIMSNFRRYENDMVKIASFGSDFAAVAGYYRPTWYAAGELGFDKSVTSYLKHSDIMRKYVFAGVQDGWYIPSGGNYYYGIQAGKTLGGGFDLSLRVGATTAEDNDKDAVLPYYLQLGLGVRF